MPNRRTAATVAAAMAAAIAAAVPAAARTPAYLDDRSTAEALIRSLYNAINLRDYARAWTYFATPPAASFAAYAAGYADTEFVELAVGAVRAEGAAGSIYYTVPVAIAAVPTEGDVRTFAGCYTVRRIQPGIQEPPATPLRIESGRLAPAMGALHAILPDCGDGTLVDPDGTARASALFEAAYGGICSADPSVHPPVVREIEITDAGAPQRFRLFQFLCFLGAYNASSLFYLENERGELLPIHFAEPRLDITYSDPLSEDVASIRVTGFTATEWLVNPAFDAETLTLRSHARWRGLGDASTSGTYAFVDGAFELVRYEVDASYDGLVNPKTVYLAGP